MRHQPLLHITRLTVLAAAVAAAIATASASALAAQPMMAEFKGPASPQEMIGLVNTLTAQRDAKGLDAEHGFVIANQHPGAFGTNLHRINHTYKNVRVWGSESVVVTNDAGAVISESVTDQRQGLGRAAGTNNSLRGGNSGNDMDVTPAFSDAHAIALMVQSLAPHGTHHHAPSAELVIYPIIKSVRIPSALHKAESELNALDLEEVVTGHELAYLVKTRMDNGGRLAFHDSIISAHDGRVMDQWSALQTVAGSGKSMYSGTVAVETTLKNGVYQMVDSTRGVGGKFGGSAITNFAHKEVGPGTLYSSSTNVWGDGKNYTGGSTTSANGQTGAVDAMWGLKNTYDMMKNVFGWKSLDGKNTASYIGVHLSTDLDNAYYDSDCICMSIGDGGSTSFQLSGLDVIGHEMSHGVTDATSKLNYKGEPGGLNEAASDIAGEMVEAYAKGGGVGASIPTTGPDWVSGREVAQNGIPLRYFYKPSKDGKSADAWSTTLSKLNVHYSSGPANRMFYFLAMGSNATSSSDYYSKYLTQAPKAMVGIGSDKAFRIWFKANTTKFTSTTNYADAQKKCVLAATELYGASSKEVNAVKRAFAAINVGTDVPGI